MKIRFLFSSVKDLALGEQTGVILVQLPNTKGANVKKTLADIGT